MTDIIISGTGLYTPKESISNKELVASYNSYVDKYNSQNEKSINSGELEPLVHSDADFII